MKKLFTALLLLVGFAAFSQTTGYFRYDSVRFEKVGGNSEFILLNSTRDSIGVLYNIGNGRTQFRTISSLGLSPNVRNGIRKSVDTLMLGDSLDRYTYIQVLSHLTNNSRFNHLRLGNLPEAQSLNGVVPPYPNMLTYNPSTFGVERIYSTANGDIDSAFYGGAISSITRILRDSTDIYFKAGVRKERLAGQGYEGVYQYFPPRDSMDMTTGRDGQSGNVGFFQFDLGNSWGYNLKVISQTDMPDYPMSLIRSSFDAMRVIDNTRTHKIVGNGWTGYLPMWKTYQNAITGSTYEAGNYTSKLSGFHVYGDAYPLIGSATTKDKILRVWKVDSAFGGIVEPMRRTTNTVYNGYSFWAKGDSDRMHIAGYLSIGGNLPTKDNGLVSDRYKFYTIGKGRFTDSLISDGNIEGFILQGQAVQIGISPSIGTQAGLGFFRTDSMTRQVATIFAETTGQPSNRYIAIRIGGNYTDAQNSIQSRGQHIRFETGPNQQFVSRIRRNGNWVVGNSAAILDYSEYKKHSVDGSGLYNDTLTLKNLIQQSVDSTTYKPLIVDALGNIYKGYWANAGTGGGGGITDLTGDVTASGSGSVVATLATVNSDVGSFTNANITVNAKGLITAASNGSGGSSTWNGITNPTGTQTLSWDDAELNAWTNGSNTETFHTVDNNSLTTGISYRWNTSSITTGNLLSLVSTSTAANDFSLLNINSSGANANSTRTANGGVISVTNTGTTSTNYGLRVTASGATNNWGIQSTPNILIGSPTLNANDALIIQSRTNNLADGIRFFSANLAGGWNMGYGQFTKAGNFDFNTTSSAISLTPNTGVLIGLSANSNSATAWLHIAAGTTTKAAQKFISGPLLTTPEAGAREYNNAHYATNNALNRYAQGGAITDFITTVGNTGTTETDLYTYTTKANTFAVNGEKLEAEFAGTATGVTTTARVLRVYFAGTVLATYQLGSTGTGVADWNVKATGIRSSSTEVRWTVNIISNVAGTVASYTDTGILTGLTLSGTNILKITGEVTGAGAGDNQLNANMGLVKWIGAANN